MGTALYRDPELCIRELLQNSLDAVQMRDLRIQLRRKLADKGREHEALSPVDSWTSEEEAKPKISLNWGHDDGDGHAWVRVRDLGTGMTLEGIRRYLSALGHSFYKSPEYHAERMLMRQHGLIATPISRFGIGIMSSFMVADWIEVRTCPCAPNMDTRKPWHVRIAGPGALFHFTEWRTEVMPRPGTEVTLHLKKEFNLQDLNRDDIVATLRSEWCYPGRSPIGEQGKHNEPPQPKAECLGKPRFNPALVAARNVIWPRYAIEAGPLIIHDWWHFDEIAPLDEAALAVQAEEWGVPATAMGTTQWKTWDWCDSEGIDATGSRIRLVVPQRVAQGDDEVGFKHPEARTPSWQISTLIAKEFYHDRDHHFCSHNRFLVHGMWVPKTWAGLYWPIASGPGAWVWIDACGDAAPSLTADRQEATPPTGDEGDRWAGITRKLQERWQHDLEQTFAGSACWPDLRTVLRLPNTSWDEVRVPQNAPAKWSLRSSLAHSWDAEVEVLARWATDSLLVEASHDDRVGTSVLGDLDHELAFKLAYEAKRGVCFHIESHLDSILARDPQFVKELRWINSIEHDNSRTAHLAIACSLALETWTKFARESCKEAAEWRLYGGEIRGLRSLGEPLRAALALSLLNEGFWPSFRRSFPPLILPAIEDGLSVASHLAPTVLWLGGPDAERQRAENWLEQTDYDIIFPLSVVARPRLLRSFAGWAQDRRWRRIFTLPLLACESLSARTIGAIAERISHPLHNVALHALVPRPALWEKPFHEWTSHDASFCGYSVQWNIAAGRVLWAVGVVPRDDMSRVGLPFQAFLKSEAFKCFKEAFPQLFSKRTKRTSKPSDGSG